ncbi:MAG: lysophospholipid acyltransferase family protein [Candidatus Binatia bacterium]
MSIARARRTPPLFARSGSRWRRTRAVTRLLLLGATTAAGYSVLVLGQTLIGRTSPRARRFRQKMFKGWCAVVLRTLAIDTTVVGELPTAPYLLVTNHLSYVDILVIGAHLETVFLARHDIAGWPVIGWAAERLGTLFINRRDYGDLQAVNAAIAAVVDRGDGLVVFPEGTSTEGRRVAPFRSPVLQPAAALELPVAYGALRYATPPGEAPASDAVCWWGDAEFTPHFWQMLHLSRIDAMLSLGSDRVTDTDRKALAQRLHQKVSTLFVPVVSGDDG